MRNYINALKIEDPAKAKFYEDNVLKRNELDQIWEEKIDMNEIKVYPGSDKGPLPEDDIDHYSKWFVENQPKSLTGGKPTDFSDIGVKKKFITVTRDDTDTNEHLQIVDYWLESDELYPLQKFKGQPEFAMMQRSNYNVKDDKDMPSIVMTTNMGVHELPPLPSEHTYNYQEVMFELERWTIFRALPPMLKYDKLMVNALDGMANGTLKVPDYMNTINPPSLWAYYETLPKWCRDHPLIRNVLMAFEYHKPGMPFRQKELALNFACSFIRPIDPMLESVIIEVATSHKIRLNI